MIIETKRTANGAIRFSVDGQSMSAKIVYKTIYDQLGFHSHCAVAFMNAAIYFGKINTDDEFTENHMLDDLLRTFCPEVKRNPKIGDFLAAVSNFAYHQCGISDEEKSTRRQEWFIPASC